MQLTCEQCHTRTAQYHVAESDATPAHVVCERCAADASELVTLTEFTRPEKLRAAGYVLGGRETPDEAIERAYADALRHPTARLTIAARDPWRPATHRDRDAVRDPFASDPDRTTRRETIGREPLYRGGPSIDHGGR